MLFPIADVNLHLLLQSSFYTCHKNHYSVLHFETRIANPKATQNIAYLILIVNNLKHFDMFPLPLPII